MTASIPLPRVYHKAPPTHKHLLEGLAGVHLHARKMSGPGRKPAIHVSLNLAIFVSSDSNDLLREKKKNLPSHPFLPSTHSGTESQQDHRGQLPWWQ